MESEVHISTSGKSWAWPAQPFFCYAVGPAYGIFTTIKPVSAVLMFTLSSKLVHTCNLIRLSSLINTSSVNLSTVILSRPCQITTSCASHHSPQKLLFLQHRSDLWAVMQLNNWNTRHTYQSTPWHTSCWWLLCAWSSSKESFLDESQSCCI